MLPPRPVTTACASLGATRAVAVLCPRALPRGRWHVGHRSLKPGQRPGTEGVVRARVLGRTTVHGGVVWTQGRASYVLTLHPGRTTGPLLARRLAVSAARSTARTP